jgi:hypothetical protein
MRVLAIVVVSVVTSLMCDGIVSEQCGQGVGETGNKDDVNIAVLLPIPANCSMSHSAPVQPVQDPSSH